MHESWILGGQMTSLLSPLWTLFINCLWLHPCGYPGGQISGIISIPAHRIFFTIFYSSFHLFFEIWNHCQKKCLLFWSFRSRSKQCVSANFSKRDESWLAYFLSWKCHRTHQGTTQTHILVFCFLNSEFPLKFHGQVAI